MDWQLLCTRQPLYQPRPYAGSGSGYRCLNYEKRLALALSCRRSRQQTRVVSREPSCPPLPLAFPRPHGVSLVRTTGVNAGERA